MAPKVEQVSDDTSQQQADNPSWQSGEASAAYERSSSESRQRTERPNPAETLDFAEGCPLKGQSDNTAIARQIASRDKESKPERFHRERRTDSDGNEVQVMYDNETGHEYENNPHTGETTIRDHKGERRAHVKQGDGETEVKLGEQDGVTITRNNQTGEITYTNEQTNEITKVNGNDVSVTKDGKELFHGTRSEYRDYLAQQQTNDGDGQDGPKQPGQPVVKVDENDNITIEGKDGEKATIDKDNAVKVKDKDGKDLVDLNKDGKVSMLGGGLSLAPDGSFVEATNTSSEDFSDYADSVISAAYTEAASVPVGSGSKAITDADVARLRQALDKLSGVAALSTGMGDIESASEAMMAFSSLSGIKNTAETQLAVQNFLKLVTGEADLSLVNQAMRNGAMTDLPGATLAALGNGSDKDKKNAA